MNDRTRSLSAIVLITGVAIIGETVATRSLALRGSAFSDADLYQFAIQACPCIITPPIDRGSGAGVLEWRLKEGRARTLAAKRFP